MISAGQIAEILALYKKHGWILRRVLLTDALRARLGADAAALFGAAEVRAATLDAAWFARPPRGGQETWELRRLSETPYALNEWLDEEDEEEVREEALREVEARLAGVNRG